jgi:hypothetical protein
MTLVTVSEVAGGLWWLAKDMMEGEKTQEPFALRKRTPLQANLRLFVV